MGKLLVGLRLQLMTTSLCMGVIFPFKAVRGKVSSYISGILNQQEGIVHAQIARSTKTRPSENWMGQLCSPLTNYVLSVYPYWYLSLL